MSLSKGFGTPPTQNWQQQRDAMAVKIMTTYETILAAAAWDFYQKQGRGYLVVTPKAPLKAGEPIQCFYCAKESQAWQQATLAKEAKGGSYAKLHSAVAAYDPETEFILMVSFSESPASEHWVVRKPVITPPVASAAAQARPEELIIQQTEIIEK
jgi:hypothetical protein